MYSDANNFAGAQVFTGIKFTYGAGGALALNYRAGAADSTAGLTTTAFSSGTVYTIEIVGNNKTSGTINYTYAGVSRSVAVQKFDLYINGALIGDDLAEAQLPTNTAINGGTFIGLNSTSNVANVFVDDAIVYNAVPAAIGPGTLQFSGAPYSDSETNADHTFTVNVSRTGGSTGAVSVNYAVTNGTATTADNDYTASPASGTLNWADSDTGNKTFNITVKGDTNYETNESVNLTLSSPTGGATIGVPNPATLTIQNDDGAPGTLVVTKTADTNGTCVVGNCSLREAINAANSNPVDANTINFNIPNTDPGLSGGVYTITPQSQLPALTASITIDGTSQTVFGGDTNAAGPEVALSGAFISIQPIPFNFVDGLILSGGSDTVKGLIISGFNTTGFFNRGILISSNNNTVQGNYIGTNAAGTAAVGNGDGVRVDSTAIGNTIGGTGVGQGNVISGNTARGLVIQSDATNTVVQGNFIGTNVTGTAAVPNALTGVELASGANQNQIGGSLAGARNIISGNGGDGVKIDGNFSNNNNVQGNYIGTNAAGTGAIQNSGAGVSINSDADSNHIGGLNPAVRNIISGNGTSGVVITGAGTSNNHVEGNYIGTDVNGTSALGNGQAGVDITGGATSNFVGDADASARNVISGNTGSLGTPAGVLIRDVGTNGNTVQSNYIGVAPDGTTALGNTGGGAGGSQGVLIMTGASNNIIGGSDPANEGNIIANNSGDGVRVADDASIGNSIRGNSIYNNTLLGINLAKTAEGNGVVTPNDALDGDTGPNNLQNFPVITSAVAGSTTVSGTLNSAAGETFEIDIYDNTSCDASGNGEGRTFLGTVTTGATNGSGNVAFSVTVPALVAGQVLTATATATTSGDTSEFSACYTAAACTPPSVVYVDDSWVGTPLGTDPDMGGPATNFGCDSFATIQGGVNGVATSGTVNVANGLYTENVTIPKALTLTGAGAAGVTLRPAISAPNTCVGASLCPGGSNLILVQASNVTISGLTLDGDNTSLAGGINVGGANIDARNGIITNHPLGTFNNLEVHHTIVRNIYLRGVYQSSSGSFNFHDNTVQNVQGEAASIGMFSFGGAGAYTNNNVSACNDAISANHSRGISFTGNTVTTSASGIHSDNAGDGGGTSDTISNNTVTNSTVNGYGIWTFVPYLPITVSNNTVTNVDVGLSAAGGTTPVATTFTGNTVNAQNKPLSTGVYLTTDQFGFGQGNNLVEFRSNTVVNAVDGFFLEANTAPIANRPSGAARELPVAVNVSETGYRPANIKEADAPDVVYTLTVNAHFNRVVNHSGSAATSTGTGIVAGDFENNWWGCNAGPNNVGCGNMVGSGVDFDPWIVLGISASPATIPPGGSTTVTADMTHNSNAAVPSVTEFVPQVAVAFAAVANGSVFPTSGTITNGQATTTFTSNSTSSGSASATVDNQTVNTPINVSAVNTYTWSPLLGSTNYTLPTNWTPNRVLPQTNDTLVIDGTTTPAPLITDIPTQTIAGLHLINSAAATLNASTIGAAKTLTLSGATLSDLTIPATNSVTLAGTTGLTINVASGSAGTIGGLVLFQDGPHRLVGNAANAITFQSGAICTTVPGTFSGNPFGSGAGAGNGAAGSVIFANGSTYSHNSGDSPFGSVGNGPVATFQTGSLARWFTSSGFQASGRTYANLQIGAGLLVPINVSDSGTGTFTFDNLTVRSTGSANSSLTYDGSSGAGGINVRGNITSTGAGSGSLPDVTLTPGSGGTNINKIGGGTIIFSTDGTNTRGIDLEGGATVANGTTLSLSRVVLLGLSNPHLNTLTVDSTADISGGPNGYVVGSLSRVAVPAGSSVFPVGTTGAYSPVDLANASGGGSLTVAARTPQQPVLAPATSLQRYWSLTKTGVLTTDLTFHYLDGDVAGNEANYRVVVVESGNATSFPADANHNVDTVNNTFTKLAVQSFSDWTAAEPAAPTAVKLNGFSAVRSGDEVKLQWQSGYEASNLGYSIYRVQDGKRVAITPSLVAGSALVAGNATRLTAGLSYVWYDQVPGVRGQGSAVRDQKSSPTYWLEDVDLNGTRTLHGPIAVTECDRGDARCKQLGERSRLLRELTNPQSAVSTQQANGVQLSSWPAAVTTADLPADEPDPTEMQRTIAASEGLKISVSRPGWYRIMQPQVLAAGLNIADANGLQLYRDGRQVPLSLSNSTEQFGPTDYLEFYGEGLNSPTAAAQIYYLVKLANPGKRIEVKEKNVGPGDRVSPQGFAYTVERKERMIYFSSLLNGDAENFFGQVVTSAAVTSSIPISHLDPSAQTAGTPAQLEVVLQGVSNQSHVVQVRFNGTNLGTINFANTEHPTQTLSVPASAIHDGNNIVELTSLGGAADVSLVDALRLTYQRSYSAENNVLAFNLDSRQTKRLTGFTSDHIRVVDVTDGNEPLELTPEILPDGAGFAALIGVDKEVRAPFSRPHKLLAFVDGQADSVDALALNAPSSLGSETAGADYVMITTAGLKSSLEPLAQLRRNQGMIVKVIDVEDLYDEFTFGEHSPRAIHDYLATAQSNWTRKPHYLLLAGDATYDPKNYTGQGMNDLVPTKLIDTTMRETASDDWLADFNGDGMADISVGRLPARSVGETNAMVAKIVAYENAAPDPSRGALLVADTSFEAPSSAIQNLLPSGMTVATINRSSADDATIHNQIIAGLNQGPLVANYIGHGSNGVWTGASLLSSDDAPTLTNTNRLSVFTMMTCFNGFFQDAYNDSLSEALLKAPGGAVAVWASTTLTEPAGQSAIDQEFYRQIFGAQPATLGDAARAAKVMTNDADVRRTWTLFGDPALRLR